MPKISKSKKATLAQGENEEPKSVRKRVTQKRQKAFLSDENSSPSGPTPNNNLDGSTNSKVLARASWADPMDPSDQAAISDAGKVPSGKKGDFTASTSKRSTPARNAKGRWSRNTRSGKTRADMQDESKDNQSDGNSQLIINQDIVAGTAGFINDDTNGCHAYALHSGIPTKEQNSELTIQCGSQSYRKKAAPGKNLSTNWLEEASVRQTVGLVTESNSRTELGTNKTIKKDCELPTQSGFLRTRKKAAQGKAISANWLKKNLARPPLDFITESNSTTDCEQKNIIKRKVQDSELPLKRCSSRKKAAPDFITESNSCIEFGPNKPIKKEVHVSELPLQKGSSRTKAAPDFNSKPNSWSKFSPNKTVKNGGQDSQLPHQSVSQSSGKKAAPDLVTELNSCSKIGPNKTIKKEVHVSQLPIQSNSHRFRKKIAPEVNLWTYFNQNTIVKKEMQDSKLPLQRGSQSSWKNAAQESSSNKTIKKEVQDSKLPIQSGSQSSRKKTATQLTSCTDFDQNKIIKMEVHNSELPLQRGTSRKKAATESSLWTELAPSTTIKNEVQNSEVPTQSGSQGSRKKAASESMSRTDFNKNQIIKQEVLDSELPIQWGSKSPSKNAAPESSSNKSIKKAVQNSEVPIQNGSQGFRKKAATQSSLWTELALNTTIKKEVQNSEVPIQSGSQSSRKKASTDFITELNLCTDFDQNQIIKKEVQDFELPIQWGSQSPRKNAAPESSSSTEFCPYKTIKKEVQDSELPIQSGSQSFRRKASTESSLWTEFSPSKTIKKEVQDSEVPNQSGSQSSWQKAATDLIAELNSLTEFSPNKTIKKEVQNSNVPIQCGSQSSRKKGASDFTKEMNSCTDFDQNKIIKREVHISELPLHRGSSRKKAATESISCTDFDQNQIIKQEVLDSELPIQWGSQSPRKNAAPESSLWTEFDQIQIIKKEVQDSELPIQWASQSRRQDAAPGKDISTNWLEEDVASPSIDFITESSSWTEFDQIQIIKKEVQDSELPIQWASQSRRQSAAPSKDIFANWLEEDSATPSIDFITDSSLWTEFSPNKTIKKEVQDSEVPDQSGSQSSWQKAATGKDISANWLEEYSASPPIDLIAELNSWTELAPNKTIKKEVQDSELPLQKGSQSPTKKAAHCTDLRTNLLEEDFAGPPIDFLAESNSWTSVRPNMFIEEKGMGPELPLDWFADESFCNWLGADAGVGSNNDEVAAELSSGIPISEEIKPQLRAPTNNRDRMRQAEDDASSAYKKPYQPAENKDIGFIKPKTSLGAADAFSRLLSNQDYDGLSFDVASKHFAMNDGSDNSKEDDIDARLGAELASLFSGEETMPKRSSKKPEEASVSETEAEIDARLQAELDSLPLVEVPEEADKSLDDLLNSLLNSDQQTAEASTAVGSQVFPSGNLQLPTVSQSTAANKAIDVINPVTHQIPQPVAGNYQRPLSQVPMVAHVTGLQGQVVSLTYTTAPDGLVTSVSTSSTKLPLAQPTKKVNELESLTASQLHQILQSGQPYLALPMIVPGGPGAGDLRPRDAAGIVSPTGQAVEDEEVDYEEIGVADTFAEYWPSKLKFGMAHPDPVVETATLSSVELPDITYQLALPQRTTSCLSALQLEAVIYACQAHEQILPSGERAGFLLGDGAGVGKGRTIAGIIFDNYMKGRKRALWVSVSNDLKFDAERDLYDIGAHDRVHVVAINKFKYSRIDSEENENFKKGVIFCTYTALIGESLTANSKYKTRLRQLVHWFGKKFDGVIVFDECHKAKNLSLMNVGKSTKTGTTVLDLQKLLPHARVVYASATGASEPRNMAYMVRLGLWGPGTAYPEFFEFVNAVEKRGIGAMEIVAMDMKLRGTYIARQLSFKDVSFRIEEVPMPKEFRKTYNLAAELWAEINKKFLKACRLMCIENRVQKIITCQFWCAHQRFFKNLCIASKVNHVVKMTRQATRMGKAVVIGLQSTGESRTLEHLERHNGRLSSFVSTSKMIIQSFVEKHFPAPKRDSFHRLLNTGEFEPEPRFRPPRPKKAKMSSDWFDDDMDAEAGESDIEMYESSLSVDDDRAKTGRKRRGRPPKAEKVEKITMQERILQHLCNNMRAQDNDGDATYTFDNTKLQKANITEHDVERCIRARELLLDKIEILGRRMPSNTLDKLISELGGTKLVAEMTGRRGRVVRTEYDGYKYEPRCESDTSMDLVNYREKQRFMVGSKHVAIISEAASSGISLQSDKRVSNQRRRLHITLELPWSADRAIQQFGRTHRSNQVNSPEYVFVITDLAGERRFASTVAKRLESLGALTQGDRRATDARDLSQFNIDNSIGRSALENVMQQLTGEKPLDHSYVPASYKGDFLYDCSVAMAGVGMLNVREENKVKLFSVEKDSNNISKFLNRILGCRVEVQNALFKFFLDKMYSLIMQMKRTGHFDLGILDLDAHGACVKSVKLMRFVRKHATGTAATELHTVTVERGMSYETALAKYRKEGRHEHDGFYVLQQLRHNKNSSILCLQAKSSTTEAATSAPGKVSLQLYRPNTGPQVRLETLSSILTRYVKVEPEAARDFWQQQYDVCLDRCSHVYWNRACPFPAGCEVGLRVRPYHVLSGLMLPIWDRIELILEKSGHKIQIIRVKTDVNKKIVGTVVPHGVYDALVADLSSDSIVESH